MLKINKVKPLFNRLLVTADKYEESVVKGGVIVTTAGTLKEYQKVLSVGSTVRDIKEGDVVLINPTRYAVRKHNPGSLKDGVITDNPVTAYNFNLVEVGDEICILLYDQDIDYVIEEYEEVPNESLILPDNTILVN